MKKKVLEVFCFAREEHLEHSWKFEGKTRTCDGLGEPELSPQIFKFCGGTSKHRAHTHGDDIMCWGEPHRKESDNE